MRRTTAALSAATTRRRNPVAIIAALIILLGIGVPNAGAWENGKLPLEALSPIASGVKCDAPAGQLSNEASAAYNSMALASGEKLPVKLPTNGCDSAYRSFERQQYYWNLYISGAGNLAAFPGSSNHGWGLAVDIPEWVQGYLKLHGARFCWRKIEAFSEPWHWNYTGCYRRPNPGPSLHTPRLRQHSGGPGQNVYVRKVQKLLRGHGDKTVRVDGDFGWQTRKAVERFQKAERIKVTGVVNRRTWKRLRQPVSKPVKTTPKTVPPAPAQPAPKAPEVENPPPRPSKPPKNRPAWGIDISSHNGCPANGHPAIDFKKVRRDGASFVITKATEDTNYINPCFGRGQVRAIGAAGLVPGVYHWLEPGGASGKAEAAFFASAIGQAGYGKGFLMPFVDVEETSSISDAAYCHELGEFVHTTKKILGEKPIIYTYSSFPGDYLSGCRFLNHYLLWIAHPGAKRPTVPAPWATWTIWQYTWTGHVAGVTGEVDVNKIRGGRNALADLRVKELPRRARLAPRAKVELPLEAEPKVVLRKAAPDPQSKGHR